MIRAARSSVGRHLMARPINPLRISWSMEGKYFRTSHFRTNRYRAAAHRARARARWVPKPSRQANESFEKRLSKIGSNTCVRAWWTTRSRKGAAEISLGLGSRTKKHRYGPGQ